MKNYEELQGAVMDGDIDKTLALLKECPKDIHAQGGIILTLAANNLAMIKFLLTSPDFLSKAKLQNGGQEAFEKSCSYGNVEVAQYLLESLSHYGVPNCYIGAIKACDQGKVNIMQLLADKINLRFRNDCLLKIAAFSGSVELVDFLVKSGLKNVDLTSARNYQVANYLLNLNPELTKETFMMLSAGIQEQILINNQFDINEPDMPRNLEPLIKTLREKEQLSGTIDVTRNTKVVKL